MRPINSLALLTPKAITATETGAGVDVSEFQGMCSVLLDSTAMGGSATPTGTVKLQHSDTQGGTYTDTGDVFAVVGAAGVSHQQLDVNADKFKKWVRVVNTLAGTSPTATFGVTLVGNKQSSP